MEARFPVSETTQRGVATPHPAEREARSTAECSPLNPLRGLRPSRPPGERREILIPFTTSKKYEPQPQFKSHLK
jgi:hypothetical protein